MTLPTRERWHRRIGSISDEFLVALTAGEFLKMQLHANPSLGVADGWSAADAKRWLQHLEATYLIRLFAAFEQALRDYWSSGLARKSHPKTEHLIDGIAARCLVPPDTCDAAHRVRRYRNLLIHEEGVAIAPVAMSEARRHLRKYVSCMPLNW